MSKRINVSCGVCQWHWRRCGRTGQHVICGRSWGWRKRLTVTKIQQQRGMRLTVGGPTTLVREPRV